MKKLIILSFLGLTQTHSTFSMLIKQKALSIPKHTKHICNDNNLDRIKEIWNKENSNTLQGLYFRNDDIINVLTKNINILREQQRLAILGTLFSSCTFPEMHNEIKELEKKLIQSLPLVKDKE